MSIKILVFLHTFKTYIAKITVIKNNSQSDGKAFFKLPSLYASHNFYGIFSLPSYHQTALNLFSMVKDKNNLPLVLHLLHSNGKKTKMSYHHFCFFRIPMVKNKNVLPLTSLFYHTYGKTPEHNYHQTTDYQLSPVKLV